jgi:large subunit ribosomal protein L31
MKEGIHPEYKEANVTCACGAAFKMASTRGSFTVDVCSQCHPFSRRRRRRPTRPPPAPPLAKSEPASASLEVVRRE